MVTFNFFNLFSNNEKTIFKLLVKSIDSNHSLLFNLFPGIKVIYFSDIICLTRYLI